MKLHEAIDAVLVGNREGRTPKEIAAAINQRKLYRRGDGAKVSASQISARVGSKSYRDRYRKDEAGRITRRGMPATAHAVRAYWSDHSYGRRPREAPTSRPIVIKDFPAPGDQCSVWFGRVPDPIREQVRIRVATGNLALNAMFGHAKRTGDEGIDDEIEKLALGFEDHAWYVTLCLERPVELDETRLTENRHVWIEPQAIEPIQNTLAADAPYAFEAIVATVAPTLNGSMFEGKERDHVYITAPGRGPVFMPRFTGSARGVVVRSMNDFPLAEVRKRLHRLPRGDQWQALATATHWYEVMLRESDDPLRRFLWGFIALEALTNELLKRLSRPTFEILREAIDPTRIPVLARFALVANELSPASAVADIATFRDLYKARNHLAHGRKRLDDKAPPSEAMREMLPRYLTIALDA